MLILPHMRSTQRIVLEWKVFKIEFSKRMNKLRFPVINDSARKTTKRLLPKKTIKNRDVATPLVRSTQRIFLELKTFKIEFFERVNKFRFPVINDSARKATKRPLPGKPIKIKDVERPL